MWSPVEKTALAEAEVEYHEKSSPTIYVKFPVIKGAHQDASIVIWTTTPWTIPGNRAIAYSPTLDYGLYEVVGADDGSLAIVGDKIAIADTLVEQTAKHAKASLNRLGAFDPKGVACAHPFRGHGYDFDVPLLPGAHVTADTGTGFVHTAPGHGEEDFELMLSTYNNYTLDHPDAFNVVGEDGSFNPQVPLFAGKRILTPEGKDGDANGAVIKELSARKMLLAKDTLRHSYPHSWRSKAPVIFRATPQWFVGMDKPITKDPSDTLRSRAMKAIHDTKWYPKSGENRLGGMVKDRPDWVLSRQRAWGVPMSIFVNKSSGKVLNDPAVNQRIVDAYKVEGADAWFNSPPSRFLGNDHDPNEYEQINDILDVWFDSGSTHVFTVEQPLEPEWPQKDHADLYLEGSDQHRGWFQSSLLESCATRGRAPYDAVLTAGFVLDREGNKMSKSVGNTILPQTVADKNGADIFRLWVASSDFTEDLRMGNDVIQANADSYRRLRNTIRFMLANLSGFDESERVVPQKMPELERFILAKLAELDGVVRDAYMEYDFNRVLNSVFVFCTNELSAFYFDIRKDSLYCDGKDDVRRRSTRTVIDEVFRRVVTWLAPILCFTMEEAWLLRFPGEHESVHLHTFPETPKTWADAALIDKWNRVRAIRRVVTGALEIARRDKVIGASLEASPTVYVAEKKVAEILASVPLAEIAITSNAHVSTHEAATDVFRLPDVAGVAVAFHHAQGNKCARCWMILPEVGRNPKHEDLCNRCSAAIDAGAGA
jgi:isoleucyl-tRNA synthetase